MKNDTCNEPSNSLPSEDPSLNPDRSSSSKVGSAVVTHSDFDRLYESLEDGGILAVDGLSKLKELLLPETGRVLFLNNFGRQLRSWYNMMGRREILDSSILAYELAVKIAPADYPRRVELLIDAGEAYARRFELNLEPLDIDEAISKLQAAVNQTPQTHQEYPIYLGSLGLLFWKRFERLGDFADLSRGITDQRAAIQYTPASHSKRSMQLNNLALALQCRYEHHGDINDLTESISTLQSAIQLTPSGNPFLPSYLNNLGISLQHHFKLTKCVEGLSDSITKFRTAVQLSPDHHLDLLPRLNNLGASLRLRFECTGNLTDLSESIWHLQQSIRRTPDDLANKPNSLNNLGASLRCRFERAGDVADLQAAISALRSSIRLAPNGDVNLPSRLANLGVLLHLSYRQAGDLSELSESITTLQTAIRDISPDHIDRPGFLHNLSSSLRYRFEHIGDIADLSESISTLRAAIHLTPNDHADLPCQLNHFGTLLRLRFNHVGEAADLTESISTLQSAIRSIPEDHADLPITLNNLANALLDRFQYIGQRIEEFADLSGAITSLENALRLTPDDHVDRPRYLTNLSNSLLLRIRHRYDDDDLSHAILTLQTAIELTPKDHIDRPSRLCSLGYALQLRFEHNREATDLTDLIPMLQTAISLTPTYHPSRPSRLCHLGNSLRHRFYLFRDMDDMTSAIDAYRQAATSKSGPSTWRLVAAQDWAGLSQNFKPSETLEAYGLSINLLAQVAGMEKTISTRHERLIDTSERISTAVSAALSFGSPMLALEWLEQGRCLVWTQLNQLRTPLNALWSVKPELADRLSRVSRMLEKAGSRETLTGEENVHGKLSLEDQAADHLKLANEWGELLNKIRRIPKFQNFLSPPCGSHIMEHLPSCGPVILINVYRFRCDALALFAKRSEPLHIPLQNFTYAKAENLRISLLNHLSSEGLRMPDEIRAGRTSQTRPKNEVIRTVLKDLWRGVAEPILEAIGFERLPLTQRRIWWCPTGPLAFLPLHAAGIYKDPPETSISVSDFAVSSYIPNVTTLIDVIKDSGSHLQLPNNILLVSQSEAPKLPRIPHADKEVESLFELMQGANIQAARISGKDATVSRVKAEMAMYRNVHLACHASQDVRHPLKSGFYLVDERPLELSEILERKIPNADMAFLSACQTSTGDTRLSEEAVHLAASMLSAGYRSVIATMWSIMDSHGPDIAKSFYSKMLGGMGDSEGLESSTQRLDGTRAAYALHHAIQNIRQNPAIGDTEKGLLSWVPYVHFGI